MTNKLLYNTIIALMMYSCLNAPMYAQEADSEGWETFPRGSASNRWIGYGPGVVKSAKSASLESFNHDDPERVVVQQYDIFEGDGVAAMHTWLSKHIIPLLNTPGPASIPVAYIPRWSLCLYSSAKPGREDALLLQIPLACVFPDMSDAKFRSLVKDWKGVLNAEESYESKVT